MPFRSCLPSPFPASRLSVVLFPSADDRSADGCTAADKQQGAPQCKAACVAGTRRFGAVLQLRRCGTAFQLFRHGVGFFDLLCAALVAVILITAIAVPILDVALGGPGRRLGRDVL